MLKAIKKKKHKVNENDQEKSLKRIKNQLNDKIAEMKEGMEVLSKVKIPKKEKNEE